MIVKIPPNESQSLPFHATLQPAGPYELEATILYTSPVVCPLVGNALAVSTGTDSLFKSTGIAIGILIITSFTKTYYILVKKMHLKKLEEKLEK